MPMEIRPDRSVKIQTGQALKRTEIPEVGLNFKKYAWVHTELPSLEKGSVTVPEKITKRGKLLTEQVLQITGQIPTPFLIDLRQTSTDDNR